MNAARTALGIIGGLAVVIGGILALVFNTAATQAKQVDAYSGALGLSTDTAGAQYVGMWVGVVIAIIGVIMLIGLLIAVAATQKAAPSVDSRSTPGAVADQV
jgi:hypothetical protein